MSEAIFMFLAGMSVVLAIYAASLGDIRTSMRYVVSGLLFAIVLVML